jgi:signal transduction histidine kinase
MRIRTQQYLIVIVSLVVVTVLASSVLSSLQRTRLEIQRNELASDIVARGTSGLRVVTSEYLVYRQDRARRQWLAGHASLGELLATQLFEGTPEQALVQLLRQQHSELVYAFDALAGPPPAGVRPHPDGAELNQQTHFGARIILLLDEMVADNQRLLRASQVNMTKAQDTVRRLVISLVIVMIGLLAIHLTLLFHQVLRPVARLDRGAREFGAGNLSFRTAVAQDNELGKLSRAFDDMARRLEETIGAQARIRQQLETANLELESFSYSVSHDLRAPLRGIDGWSLALVEDYASRLDATALQYLGRIRAETRRMGQLIDDLLKLSRINRGEMHVDEVDLTKLATEIAGRLQQEFAPRDIEFIVQPGLVAAGDRQLLEIALGNLLGNACKFTGPRPRARIEFGVTRAAPPGAAGPREAFFVRDNGVGFDMTNAKHLFGAFQRMHKMSEFPGTGIGLATVDRIIRRHGGATWAEAEPGFGACFYFTLPPAVALEGGTAAESWPTGPA